MGVALVVPKVWRLLRAGSIEPNPTTIQQRAAAFAAGATEGTVLLTRRDDGGLSHYLIAPDDEVADAANIQLHLAQAVAARAELVDVPEGLFASRRIAQARYAVGTVMGRDTQVGADIAEVSRLLASSLRPGEWVAIVLRQPGSREVRRYQRWLQYQVGGGAKPTHHSMSPSALVMSLWAGAETTGASRSLLKQLWASLPGFDVQIRSSVVSRFRKGAITIVVGLGLAVSGSWLLASDVLDQFSVTAAIAGLAAGVGLPIAVGGVLYLLGRVPSYADKVRRFARFNLLLPPRHRLFPPAHPSREFLDKAGAVQRVARDGGYPLDVHSFMAGPAMPVSIVAPHAGAASGEASTQQRGAPPTMRGRIGPFIGYNDSLPVHLSADDGWGGVFCVGQAGSGKSRLIQSLFAWAGLEHTQPSGLVGFPGRSNTLIAFESKGEGADAYQRWSKVVGDEVLRIDFAGTGNVQLDLWSIGGSAEYRARAAVNAFKYAFDDGSVGPESFVTLTAVFTAAFTVTPEIVAGVNGVSAGASPFYYANILLGNRGDELGVALAGAIRSEAARVSASPESDLGQASEKLASLYQSLTPAQRGQLTKAPRNKVSALLAAESWWSRPQRITWDRILTQHYPVVFNTGDARTGGIADDQLVDHVSALAMYTLYEAIKRNCSGWSEAGRSVTIFADELKLLAGSSATVITWLRDQGRSYGVRAVFATQYPEQLSAEVRNSVMGFGTLLAFAQNNPDVVRSLVNDFTLAGDEWNGSDVANLQPFETIVRATVGRKRQAPFTLKIHDFWTDQDNFAPLQGYEPLPGNTPAGEL